MGSTSGGVAIYFYFDYWLKFWKTTFQLFLKANGQGGGIPPAFVVKRGYGQNTAVGSAPTCPQLPQTQFSLAIKVPAAVAEHAHFIFFFSSTLLGLTGPRRTRSPLWTTYWGGVCPRKSTKFTYYPRVTINSPNLTEIIPLHDHLWQPQRQVQTHVHVIVQQPEQSKGQTTGSCE